MFYTSVPKLSPLTSLLPPPAAINRLQQRGKIFAPFPFCRRFLFLRGTVIFDLPPLCQQGDPSP